MDKIIKRSILIENGNPARYRLQTSTDNSNKSKLRKMTFGEGDKNKPHKTILMLGETGAGKTTLINVIINYMLGVQREDKVWFEITDDQSDRTQAHSQTSITTVYEFYPQESKTHLTIIDTPGYGDTRGVDLDKEIPESCFSLSESAEGINELDAVCLVMMAHQNRLTDRLIYIFNSVQSLFGRDITENIVLIFTHSDGARPKNALTAVEEAEIKCAMNSKKQPVFFRFNNRQSVTADEDDDDEERERIQQQSWDLSFRGIEGLFKFLDTIKPKTLRMTRDVFQQKKQLEANINILKSRVEMMELKKIELNQTQEALEKHKKDARDFEVEVDVSYKAKAIVDYSKANVAVCCSVCEENCHYPGCWWVTSVYQCTVMKDDHCTVCTNKCHYSKHVKAAQIYVTKTKKEKRTSEDLKKKYDDKLRDGVSVLKKLEGELQELEKGKEKIVIEAFHCVDTLEKIALTMDSPITLLHIDFLIEKLKEINEPDKAKRLENIKRSGEGNGGEHAL